MSFTLIVPQTSIWYLVRSAIALSFYAIAHQKKERAIALSLWGEILHPYSGDVKIQDSNSNS